MVYQGDTQTVFTVKLSGDATVLPRILDVFRVRGILFTGLTFHSDDGVTGLATVLCEDVGEFNTSVTLRLLEAEFCVLSVSATTQRGVLPKLAQEQTIAA